MGSGAVVIVHGVCVGDWGRFTANVVPHALGPIIALSGQTSIADAYNSILHACQGMSIEALILQHDDLEIIDPDTRVKLLTALAQPDVWLIGVAGGTGRHGLAWWNHDPIGHQQTDAMTIDFGQREGEVELVEGSIMIFSPDAVGAVRFDNQFPGFHGYDEIAAQIRHSGGRVQVADIDTHHHTQMGFKTEQSHGDWLAADSLYRRKWDL